MSRELKIIEVETLFIGGGPATLGVLSNAYQTQRIDDLIAQGIAIIDYSDQFGGGNLQKHYGIKSNTSATGFLKVLMYPKVYAPAPQPSPAPPVEFNKTSSTLLQKTKSKTEVTSVNNKGMKLQESHKQFLPQFQAFGESSEIVRTLKRHGKKVAPLQLIGTFLSYAGNQMLSDIFTKFNKKIFYGKHKAIKIC